MDASSTIPDGKELVVVAIDTSHSQAMVLREVSSGPRESSCDKTQTMVQLYGCMDEWGCEPGVDDYVLANNQWNLALNQATSERAQGGTRNKCLKSVGRPISSSHKVLRSHNKACVPSPLHSVSQ